MTAIRRRSAFSVLAGGIAAALSSTAVGAAGHGARKRPLITVGRQTGVRMPQEFVGLSYESTQLYDPSFFSPRNAALVEQFSAFNHKGILRLGGNLSDASRWQSELGDFATPKAIEAQQNGRQAWEWKLTSAAARASRNGAVTPTSLSMLRGFLDETDWTVIYGLNFGSGDMARTVDEASHAARLLGDRLLAFQIGNEVDFFAGNPRYRDLGYDFDRYIEEVRHWWTAVRSAAPSARLGGPDSAVSSEWVERFAAEMRQDADFVSSHYYAMGPAKDPAMTAERLLAPNGKLDKQIAAVRQTIGRWNVPFRLTEANSCFGGGRPGVSDAYASALWAADFLIQTAQAGYASVALHGGGDGVYTPIYAVDGPAKPRPIFFGAQFANTFVDCEMLECRVNDAHAVSAYAARRGKTHMLALINKSANAVAPEIHWPDITNRRPSSTVTLQGPSLDATGGVELRKSRGSQNEVLPYSAQILFWI